MPDKLRAKHFVLAKNQKESPHTDSQQRQRSRIPAFGFRIQGPSCLRFARIAFERATRWTLSLMIYRKGITIVPNPLHLESFDWQIRNLGDALFTEKLSRAVAGKYLLLLLFSVALLAPYSFAQSKRKVVIDQDAAGPGGTDQQAILALVNSPDTEVLGITVLTGDAWRDEEVLHTLRTLEIVGRTDIPVFPGANFPLVNSKEYMAKWETTYGKILYQGAWNFAGSGHAVHGPYEIPPMPEGAPTTKASTEDAAHFMVRMVRQYPHEVTIYAAGPMTNLALAIALDAKFPELCRELILMGGSINPQTDDPEFTLTPKREFNLWMDPEASHAVFHAHWPRIVVTTVDISVKTHMEKIADRRNPQVIVCRRAVRREIRRCGISLG